jgi:hypothetical protein
MDPYGTYSGISQVIEYGINATNMAEHWSSTASYGPPPYVNALGETVTEINNTYIHHIIMAALGALPTTREKLYNEMMDIYYAEAAGEGLYQAIGRHYEREWINGWVGGYSNNPIAPGPYFYQMWKQTSLPFYGVDLSCTITNTTYIPPITVDNLTGNMLDWKTLNVVYVNYTIHVEYLSPLTGPAVNVSIELERTDIWNTSLDPDIMILFISMVPGESYTRNVQWHESNTMTNGIWKISLRIDPLSTAGGIVYDTNTSNNVASSPYLVKSMHTDKTYVVGDLGGGVPPTFELFDQKVDGKDLALFVQCYHEVASPSEMYKADLGSGIPPKFFNYDATVDGKDLALFLQCYHEKVQTLRAVAENSNSQ